MKAYRRKKDGPVCGSGPRGRGHEVEKGGKGARVSGKKTGVQHGGNGKPKKKLLLKESWREELRKGVFHFEVRRGG